MKLIRTSFLEVDDAPGESMCSQCFGCNKRVWKTARFAIDSTAERQGLLKVNIGVYRCDECQRYYRCNPKFIRPRHLYTNKIINVAIASAVEDKMPVSRIRHRLARDFGVKPAESAIRDWIQRAGDEIIVDAVLPKSKQDFSGILCIDEVYSGKLAILIATDPVQKDALVAFDLSDDDLSQEDVREFLQKMHRQGIHPQKVITDQSSLYPKVINEIWPQVSHQLCLFHLSQKVSDLAKKAVRKISKGLPKKPKGPSKNATKKDVLTALILHKNGKDKRKIAKELGISRNSLKRWIADSELVKRRYGIKASEIESALKKNNLSFRR